MNLGSSFPGGVFSLLGYYNYTVVATYVSLVVSVLGIFQAWEGRSLLSIFCLMLSGLLDAFDGKIARTKLDRTEEEKRFGIQLDSLCDMVCFGVLPAAICRSFGMKNGWALAVCCLYILCAQIRLAFFNVQEEERQSQTKANRSCYSGVPVTTIALLLPPVYLLRGCGADCVCLAAGCMLLIVGILFISPVRVPKPQKIGIAAVIAIGILEVVLLLLAK